MWSASVRGALVAHHQVDGLVGAEDVAHAHDVRMLQARDGARLLEEQLHPRAEHGEVSLGDLRLRRAVHAQRERRRQVLLDRDRLVLLVVREVDERKAAGREHAHDAVVLEPRAFGERLVGLRGHLLYDSARTCPFPFKA